MTIGKRFFRGRLARAAAASATFGAIVITGLAIGSSQGRANDRDRDNGDEASQIRTGLAIAPVPLNMVHKDRDLVGLGSFIVNAVSDCNGCHTANPATEYTGNPALFAPPSLSVHQTKKVNPATYLGGGQDFGP